MILLDANILIYATMSALPEHPAARKWLEKSLASPGRVGIGWATLLAFVRVVSNPRIFRPALSVADAWKRAEEWLDLENVWIPLPTETHREVLGRLLRTQAGRTELVPDADLAALAIEHGLVLVSTDGDFGRFRELRWENPLRS